MGHLEVSFVLFRLKFIDRFVLCDRVGEYVFDVEACLKFMSGNCKVEVYSIVTAGKQVSTGVVDL